MGQVRDETAHEGLEAGERARQRIDGWIEACGGLPAPDETAAPLAASFTKAAPTEVHRIPSFVDGIGASSVLPEMWNLVRPLLEGSLVVSLKEIASAIRLLVERNRVVAEGAGGSSVAAALAGKAGQGRVACVVSGGNIDTEVLGKILRGEVP